MRHAFNQLKPEADDMPAESNFPSGHDNDPISEEPLTARPDHARRRVSMFTAGLLALMLIITAGHWLYFYGSHAGDDNLSVPLKLDNRQSVAG